MASIEYAPGDFFGAIIRAAAQYAEVTGTPPSIVIGELTCNLLGAGIAGASTPEKEKEFLDFVMAQAREAAALMKPWAEEIQANQEKVAEFNEAVRNNGGKVGNA